LAPARSPLEVNLIGVPRIVDFSETLPKSFRSSVRVILPSFHAVVTALEYICART